jgi:hypothetical protein
LNFFERFLNLNLFISTQTSSLMNKKCHRFRETKQRVAI